MDLKEFVHESLVAILDGVNCAQREIKQRSIGAAVNPKFDDMPDLFDADVQTMEFDIAVSVSEKSEGNAGAALKVVGILDAGGRVSQGVEAGSVSRIKFALKILPSFTTVSRKLRPG